MLDAVILAGGKSSRMGQDKALLPFKGYNSLAEYQYKRLKPLFSNVYLSAKEYKFDFQAPFICDNTKAVSSPLIALEAIMQTLQKPFFLIAVDMPLLPLSEIEKLLWHFYKNPSFDAYLFKSPNGLEPLATIYKSSTLATLQRMLQKNDHKMNTFLSKINFTMVESNYQSYFTNLNYFTEYKKISTLSKI